MPPDNLPEGWRQVQLGDLLNEEQQQRVQAILNSSMDDIAAASALKQYLSQFRADLEAKGVLPEYLAYALVYTLRQ